MPIRTKAIDNLADSIGDYDLAEEAYLSLVENIDWNRVKLEATSRCLSLHEKSISEDTDLGCGDCIAAVMTTNFTYPDWEESAS